MGLVPTQLPGTAGSLEAVPLLVAREAGFWRLVETAEAIESWVTESTRFCFAVSTSPYPR